MARRNRVNRIGLEILLASVSDSQLLELNPLLALAQTQSCIPTDGTLDNESMKAIDPAAVVNSYDERKWPLYTLFGSLVPLTATRSAEPDRWTFQYPARALDAVRQMLFESDEYKPVLTDREGKDIDRGFLNLLKDWTELLPAGMPCGASPQSNQPKDACRFLRRFRSGRSRR